jgi:hypothetical protein
MVKSDLSTMNLYFANPSLLSYSSPVKLGLQYAGCIKLARDRTVELKLIHILLLSLNGMALSITMGAGPGLSLNGVSLDA